jgi:hypothetical protein
VRSLKLSFLLLPIVLSFWLLAAHFLRNGHVVLCIGLVVFPLLLSIQRPWIARFIQAALGLSALIWMQSTYLMMSERLIMGDDWMRMSAIMLGVIGFTILSACAFLHPLLENRYSLRD